MASRSLNKICLIGNLTRDPELRYTPQGTAVCNFGLATNRSWTDSNGETQEEAEFHRIVAWQKLAEICSQLLFKGRKAYVEGRLQTRKWQDNDGNDRKTTEIVINNMIVLDSRQKPDNKYNQSQAKSSKPDKSDNKKSAKDKGKSDKKKKSAKPVKKDKNSEEVSPDDIPF